MNDTCLINRTMHEIIYNIYVWDYHYETAIDEEWLAFLMHEAKERAQGRPIRVEKEKISIEEMNSIMQAKIDDNEKIWWDAKKTKNPAEYVERYWLLKDIEKEKALAIHNT